MKIDCNAPLPSWHNLQNLFSVIAKVLFEFSNSEMISWNFSRTSSYGINIVRKF